MQPELEFRQALLSAPNLSVPNAFSDTIPFGMMLPADWSAQLTLLRRDQRAAACACELASLGGGVHHLVALVGQLIAQVEALCICRGQA